MYIVVGLVGVGFVIVVKYLFQLGQFIGFDVEMVEGIIVCICVVCQFGFYCCVVEMVECIVFDVGCLNVFVVEDLVEGVFDCCGVCV